MDNHREELSIHVTLMPVSANNWYACTQLKVKPEQLRVFPTPVVYWIAESKFAESFELGAIYAEETLVGFLVCGNAPDEDGNHWIFALMIDEHHQGKGYGKLAMERLVARMASRGVKRVMIGHRPENAAADRLYEGLGFHRISEALIDGEVVRALRLS